MITKILRTIVFTLFAISAPTWAQTPEPPPVLLAKQKAAMNQLAYLDGEWRGTAWSIDHTGKRHELVQTERAGSFLSESVKVIEGRGFNPDGSVGFNALAVISYNIAANTWSLRSWAQGHSGEFPFVPTADGYIWTTPAGPGATMRYTAVIKGDNWFEIGEYIVAGQPPRKMFEMNVKRIGAGKWPLAGEIPMK